MANEDKINVLSYSQWMEEEKEEKNHEKYFFKQKSSRKEEFTQMKINEFVPSLSRSSFFPNKLCVG